MPLSAPARYAPWLSGKYEVTAGLRPLGTDFGNGPADRLHFQFDTEWPRYREEKLRARADRYAAHVGSSELPEAVAEAVGRFLVNTLTREHPEHFEADLRPRAKDRHLDCHLTDESLSFGPQSFFGPGLELLSARSSARPRYADLLDAMACQIQEDLAITCTVKGPDGDRNWLAYLHVCCPSGWRPDEKLGHDFREVHAPVAGFQKLSAAAPQLVRTMVANGPQVRFVWGLSGTGRPNRYPEPPAGASAEEWLPPVFDPQRDPPFWLSVERQVMVPFRQLGASLFLIRPYLVPATEIRADPESAARLADALAGMPEESRAYKGISRCADAMAAWLRQPA